MKAVILLCVLSTMVAVSVAQGDALSRMAMFNMMRGQGGSSGAGASRGVSAAAGGNPLAAMLGAGGAGMGRGLGMVALTGGLNDRARDMMMCQMMPAAMRQFCLMSTMMA